MIVLAELETAYKNITILCSLKTTQALLLGREKDKILIIIPKYSSYTCLKKTHHLYISESYTC